jgi:DNA primase
VVSLPEGEDPDTFVAKHGAARLEQSLAEAMDLFERQLQILERKGWFADLSRTRKAVDRLLPTIRATRDPLTRDLYVSRLGEAARIDKTLLLREAEERPAPRAAEGGTKRRGTGPDDGARLDGAPREWQGGAMGPGAEAPREARSSNYEKREKDRRWKRDRRKGDEWESLTAPPRRTEGPARNAERLLVKVMLHHPQQLESIATRVALEQIADAVYAEIYAALVERGAAYDREELAGALSGPATLALDQMFDAPDEVAAPVRIVEDSATQLELRALRAESDDLDRALARADGPLKDQLIEQKRRVGEEIRRRGGKGFGHYLRLG